MKLAYEYLDELLRKVNDMILKAHNIVKYYSKRAVVDDISLEVNRGEIVGLLGPNGAGKTTCFYMMVGLVRPYSGIISLDDLDITQLAMYKRAQLGVGYLAQEASIFRTMSVEDNILTVLETLNLDKDTQQIELEKILDDFGLLHIRKTRAVI